ncbi:hypothetical protein T09_10145 [Trichinella sp. T9]|nr:hypothetical protein T09_10145 [Trichinella sp. T9]
MLALLQSSVVDYNSLAGQKAPINNLKIGSFFAFIVSEQPLSSAQTSK